MHTSKVTTSQLIYICDNSIENIKEISPYFNGLTYEDLNITNDATSIKVKPNELSLSTNIGHNNNNIYIYIYI